MRSGFGAGAKRIQGGFGGNNNFAQTQKRKIENLARTGTEYPLMKMSHSFIPQTPEKEPLSEKTCPATI